MREHGSRRAARPAQSAMGGASHGPGGARGGRRSANAGGAGDKLSGLAGSLSGVFARRGSEDVPGSHQSPGGGADRGDGGAGNRGGGNGGAGPGFGRGRHPKSSTPPPKDWWLRYVNYPRYGKTGWRHWMLSIKQVLSMFLAFVFSIIGLISIAYADTKIPAQTHAIANGVQTTFTYDDGTTAIAKIGLPIDRKTINQIPLIVQNAVISLEDKTFRTNPGVSFTGVARSALNNMMGGGKQGGSTITQQYVKNAYLTQEQTLSRKITEVFTSIKLSQSETKNEILESYLNTISFGRGCYGIGCASKEYLGVDVSTITDPGQAAFLAALIQSPSTFAGALTQGSPAAGQPDKDSTTHPLAHRNFKARYQNALENMATYGYIQPAQAAAEKETLPKYNPPTTQTLSGYTGYLKDAATSYLAKVHSTDPYGKYTDINELEKGGYTVVTTYNKQMMDDSVTAADALWKNPGWNPAKHPSDHDIHLAFASIQPSTGYLKSFYTGIDGAENYNAVSFNSALQGGFQVGSTFKPITLATALETGKFNADSLEPASNQAKALYDPYNSTSPHDKLTYVDTHGRTQNWPPNEDGEGSHGTADVPLRFGMEQSYNTVYADLEMDPNVGKSAVYKMATKLGIPTSTPDFFVVPSLTLGTAEITPMRMASAYATFANNGVHHDPIQVTKIIDANGKTVWTPPDAAGVAVMQPSTAAGVADMMKGVLTKGTASGNHNAAAFAAKYTNVAGKTGTTDSNHAAWFDGYTTGLSTAVGIYRQTGATLEPLTGLTSNDQTVRVNGMSLPTDVWSALMNIEAGRAPTTFAKPFTAYANTCTNTSPGTAVNPNPGSTATGLTDAVGANGCINQPVPTATTTVPTTAPATLPPTQAACSYGYDIVGQCVASPPPATTDPTPSTPGTPTDSGTPVTQTGTPGSTPTIDCTKKVNKNDPACQTGAPTPSGTPTTPTPTGTGA